MGLYAIIFDIIYYYRSLFTFIYNKFKISKFPLP